MMSRGDKQEAAMEAQCTRFGPERKESAPPARVPEEGAIRTRTLAHGHFAFPDSVYTELLFKQ